MWKVEIKSWIWVEIEGQRELKKGTINFEFKTLNEVTDFVEQVVEHSDVCEFEIEYVKGE